MPDCELFKGLHVLKRRLFRIMIVMIQDGSNNDST